MVRELGVSVLVLLVWISMTGCQLIKFEKTFFAETPNDLFHSCDEKRIDFVWAEGTYGDYVEPHNAMVIEVSLNNMPQRFYFQFDTGSPSSYLYGNPLGSLEEMGLNLKVVERGDKPFVQGFDFKQAGKEFSISNFQILEGYGKAINENDTATNVLLGTIGTDFIDDKIAVIDFENQFIITYVNRPDWMDALKGFRQFDFTGRRLLLPASIDGNDLNLIYDTGSSAFGLITSKNRYKKYTDRKEPAIEYEANSWGESIPVYHKITDKKLDIGGCHLNLNRISYVGMYGSLQRFVTPFTKIGGWLGNKLFLRSALIMDTQKQEFAVLDELTEILLSQRTSFRRYPVLGAGLREQLDQQD